MHVKELSMKSRRMYASLAALAVAGGSLTLAACGSSDSTTDTAASGGGDALAGKITIDGSSTVAPLSTAAAESFNGKNPDVNITVGTSGTGGGFEVFCKGETDISNASRGIKDDEAAACKAAGVEYEEIRVASDGITLVTKTGVDVGKACLTFPELKKAWAPGSKVDNWSQLGSGFKDLPLTLAGAGSQSGTYDFFNETILGEDAQGEVIQPRQDYAASEDDNVTVRAIQDAEAGMGYFGFSYYEANTDTMQAFAIDGGDGCVEPTTESITSGKYPISRPLFIYVSKKSLARPEVKAFAKDYVATSTELATAAQFVPAPQSALDESMAKLDAAS
jgi:phosphate transport system substrate-binding protein